MIMDRSPQNVMRREFRTIWVLLIWSVFRLSVFMLSLVRLLATLWIVAHQVPLSMGFLRQEYWSELPFPSPVDLHIGRQILYH